MSLLCLFCTTIILKQNSLTLGLQLSSHFKIEHRVFWHLVFIWFSVLLCRLSLSLSVFIVIPLSCKALNL